jgi:hypothetical protein
MPSTDAMITMTARKERRTDVATSIGFPFSERLPDLSD